MVTTAEYASLAQAAYNNTGAPSGWTRQNAPPNTSGYGNDILAGGTGDDSLNGGPGSDTYLFNRGDGNDRIETYWGGNGNDKDTLSFGVGIGIQDVSAYVNKSGELVLLVDGGNGGSTVSQWYDSAMNENQYLPLSRVQFVTAAGDMQIIDMVGLMRAKAGALANSDKNRPAATMPWPTLKTAIRSQLLLMPT